MTQEQRVPGQASLQALDVPTCSCSWEQAASFSRLVPGLDTRGSGMRSTCPRAPAGRQSRRPGRRGWQAERCCVCAGYTRDPSPVDLGFPRPSLLNVQLTDQQNGSPSGACSKGRHSGLRPSKSGWAFYKKPQMIREQVGGTLSKIASPIRVSANSCAPLTGPSTL